ncbi:MAG: MarR family transcriptional regulator [Planctomycetes bacterium]|nr:MarR family transcriptional regulator [Planctomycetota bacterium]
MKDLARSKALGSRRRTQVLLLLALLGDSYVAELARLLGVRPFTITGIVDGLEHEGLIGSRLMGRQRLFRLEPRYFAARELKALLLKLAEGEPELMDQLASLRRRPRRRGKPLREGDL